MKIVTEIGNLLHVKAGHIVHGCNAQGVMGSGVALGVKQAWPHVFHAYEGIHSSVGLELGQAYPVLATPTLVVWNAITQNLFGKTQRFTNYEAVATCFEQVNAYIRDESNSANQAGIPQEIHIPMIGAARGGGNWEIIREIIEQTVEYPVTLWLPDNTVTTI